MEKMTKIDLVININLKVFTVGLQKILYNQLMMISQSQRLTNQLIILCLD